MLTDEEKIAQEVTPEDIKELIGVNEGQRLDYKKELYGKEKKQECLKDISAFANATGGYIILGIKETNAVATEICGVNSNEIRSEIERIVQWLHHGLTPPICPTPTIHWLEIDEKKVVIIQIPESENKPHQVSFLSTLPQFYIRHGDSIPVMRYEELRDMFQARPEARRLQHVQNMLEKVITTRTDYERLQMTLSESDLLKFNSIDTFIEATRKVFLDSIKDKPYFRLISILEPFAIRDDVRNQSQAIMQAINTPKFKYSDWVQPISRMIPSQIGIISSDEDYRYIRVLWNGCIDFGHAVKEFMLDHNDAKGRTLNPYGIIYPTLGFINLLKIICQILNWEGRIVIKAGFFNIKEFRLIGGHPDSINYRIGLTRSMNGCASVGVAQEMNIESDMLEVSLQDINILLAYKIIRQLYMAFGLDSKAIPLFDKDGNFKE